MMGMPAIRPSHVVRRAAAGIVLILACSTQVLCSTQVFAQGQSAPIQSPQDAACRNEARARVFTAPDPQGLGLYAVGRQIYIGCMQRAKAPPSSRRARLRDASR